MKELDKSIEIKNNITQKQLKDILIYDKETGIFRYKIKISSRHKVGDEIAKDSYERYKRIKILGIRFSLHHLAILYIDGYLPKYKDGKGTIVDHIDRNTHNNKYNNLNVCSNSENNKNRKLMSNNSSRLSGVFKMDYGWRVRVQQDYKRIQIYKGKDFFEACCARLSFNNKNGFSKSHGILNNYEIKTLFNNYSIDDYFEENTEILKIQNNSIGY